MLVILLSAAVLTLQRFLVYDESGTPGLRFPQEGGEGTASALPSVSPDDLQITIERPGNKADGGLWLADTPLHSSGEALARMKAAGVTRVCLTVKDAEGYVYIDSAATAALSRATVAADTVSKHAVAELLADPTVTGTAAKISCFRDSRVPILDVRALGLRKHSGYLYYDGSGASWLDPGKEAAVSYLTSLARECAALGFDEILLTDVSYPTSGAVSEINTGTEDRSAVLADFLRTMRAALAEYDVRLSLELPSSAVLFDGGDISGQSLAVLAPLADCIYVPALASQIPQLAEAVMAVAPETDFCPIVTDGAELTGTYLIKE